MAEDIVRTGIEINIDTASAVSQLNVLENQISQFNSRIVSSNDALRTALSANTKILQQQIGDLGQFSTQVKTMQTSVSMFSTALEKGKLSFGEYFRYGLASTKAFGRNFTKELDLINATAEDRVKRLSTRYVSLGREVNGMQKMLAIRPEILPEGMDTQLALAAQKQQIFNQLLRQGSTHLVNWGKNTQWAGRQLMVGFTVPLTIFGGIAAKIFTDLERQAINFRRVYGDAFTPAGETDAMLEEVKTLSIEFTKYGISASETMDMAAKAAATGAQGADLLAATTQATRLATLGQIEQQQALDATIALQSAFSLSSTELADSVNFLNAVENQTVVSLDDITQAIPRAATVVQGLGGDVRDLSAFLAAMRENGVNAAEGANALKSGLASLINPTKQAREQLEAVGIDIKTIIETNRGDLMGTVQAFAQAVNALDPLTRQQTLAQVFGKYQFARLGALFENIVKDGSQASRVLELMGQDVSSLAALADKELGTIEGAIGVKFQGAIERLKIAIAPIGEIFLKIATPIVEAATKAIDAFNSMPIAIKTAVTAVIALLAGIAPVFLMGIGLIGNGLGNMIKGFDVLRGAYQRMTGKVTGATGPMTQAFGFMSNAELDAAAAAGSLNGKLDGLTATALLNKDAIDGLTGSYMRFAGAMNQAATARPQGVMASGRTPRRMARGGFVGGEGNKDSEPALLMPGEFVMNKDASEKFAPILMAMNQGKIAGYAKGRNIAIPGGGSVDLNLPDRNTQKVQEAIEKRLRMASEKGAEALEAFVRVLRSMTGEIEVTSAKIDEVVSNIPEISDLALSEKRSGAPTTIQRQSSQMDWQTRGAEISAIQSEVAQKWPQIAENTKKMRNLTNTQASHLEVINAAGERVDRDWTDLANLTPDLGAMNNYLNRVKSMTISAEDVARIMAETGLSQAQVETEIDKLRREIHPATKEAAQVYTSLARLDEELSLAALEAGQVRTRLNTIAETGYQATAVAAAGTVRTTAPQGADFYSTMDDRQYQQAGQRMATAINSGIQQGNPGIVIEQEVMQNAKAASPPPWSFLLGNWIGEGINAGMEQTVRQPTLAPSQMRGAVMLGGASGMAPDPQIAKNIEELGLASGKAAIASEKDAVATNVEAAAHIENATVTNAESGAKKKGLGGFGKMLFALDGLSLAMSFLPGPIGEIANKVFIASAALSALSSFIKIELIAGALKKLVAALTAAAVASGLKGAAQGVSSAASLASTGADVAITAALLKGSKVGKIGGMFTKFLGPIARFGALIGRMLPAIGRLTMAFGKFIGILVNGIPGVGQLLSAIIIIGTTIAGYAIAYKMAGDQVRKLGETAKLTGDEIKGLAEKFGFTERTTGFAQQRTVLGNTAEARSVAQEARTFVQEDSGMQARVENIRGISDTEAQAVLRSLFMDVLASGASREVATGIVEAVALEAGKQRVFVPVQADLEMSFDDKGKIKDVGDFIKDNLTPSVQVLQSSLDNLSKTGFNKTFDQGAVDDAKRWVAAVDMLPESIQSAIVPQYQQKKAILATASSFELLKSNSQTAMNLLSAEFVNGTMSVKEYNAGMQEVYNSLTSLPNNQGLQIMKDQLIALYPESQATITSLTDTKIAFDILSLSAQGVQMGGFIQQMQQAGWTAEETRKRLQGLIDTQNAMAGVDKGIAKIEADLAAERAKPGPTKGTDGTGGTKDPFADRENKLRNEQAEITIKEIKLDRTAEDRFDRELQSRFGDTSITVSGIEMPLDSIQSTEFAIDAIGEQIEDIERGPLQAYQDRIDAINEDIQVYQDQLGAINHDIDLQEQAIRRIEEEYAPILDALNQQKNAQEDILQGLEDQRDAAIRPYEDQIAVLERQLRIAEQAAKPRLDALDNEEKALDKQTESLDEQISYIDEQKDALNQVAKINEYIARQQKNRLGLTQALAEGDIYAATAAANQMKQDAADQATEQQQNAFDAQQKSLEDQKKLIEDRKSAIDDEREAIQAGLDVIQDQIDAQEYQKFLIEDSYRLSIQAANDAIKATDREIAKQTELRDARIKPYQDIIDSYAPQIDAINNAIYNQEQDIKDIQADMKPYEDTIANLTRQKDLLEDIKSDALAAVERDKAALARRKQYLDQELQILAAKREIADIESGGGGTAGTEGTRDNAKIKALEAELARLKLERQELIKAQNKLGAGEAVVEDTSWYTGIIEGAKNAWTSFTDWFDQNVVQPIVNNPIVRAVAAVGVAISQILAEAFSSALVKVQEIWSTFTGWFNTTIIEPIKAFFAPFGDFILNTVLPPIKAVWNGLVTWFNNTIITPIKNMWSSIVTWIDTNLIAPLRTAWGNFYDWTRQPFEKMVADVKDFFKNIPETIATFIASIPDKFAAIVGDADKKTGILGKLVAIKDWFVDLPNTVTESFKGVGQIIIDALKGGLNAIIDIWNGLRLEIGGFDVLGKQVGPWTLDTPNIPRFNAGGMVKYGMGGVAGDGNRDSVPAMLTPGEFVIRKAMVDKYGVPALSALNQGSFAMPRYNMAESTAGNVSVKTENNTNLLAPMYNNYSVNVSVSNTSASADEIANKTIMKIKQMQDMQVRSGRGY